MTRSRCYIVPSEVRRAYTMLTRQPQEVRVVSRGGRTEVIVGASHSKVSIAGLFDMSIPLRDFTEALECAAVELYGSKE